MPVTGCQFLLIGPCFSMPQFTPHHYGIIDSYSAGPRCYSPPGLYPSSSLSFKASLTSPHLDDSWSLESQLNFLQDSMFESSGLYLKDSQKFPLCVLCYSFIVSMPCCMLIVPGITIRHPAISMTDFKFLEDKE